MNGDDKGFRGFGAGVIAARRFFVLSVGLRVGRHYILYARDSIIQLDKGKIICKPTVITSVNKPHKLGKIMSNRLTKIYTRTGDDGTTGMADGTRLSKTDNRFEAMGKVDMLNSHIGLLRTIFREIKDLSISTCLLDIDVTLNHIQHQLFNIGGELAMPEYHMLTADHTHHLENQIDTWNDILPRLKDFILPAGSQAVCQVHIARCACREAERAVVGVQQQDSNVSQETLSYINRLSDWLFVLARIVAKAEGSAEVFWQKDI